MPAQPRAAADKDGQAGTGRAYLVRLLVVEDDEKTVRLLKQGLGEYGFAADDCRNGVDGLEMALSHAYDLIVLDVMLPGKDGWEVLAQLRAADCHIPVVMLSARDAVEHRVKGLMEGADEYIVKPFAFSELLARIQNVLRRRKDFVPDRLSFADLTLNHKRLTVERAGQDIDLTSKQFLLLELLLRQQGEVLSRNYIAEQVWDMSFDGDSNVVEVNICRLRAKVDDPFERKLIHTIRGRGYVIR
jgi:two-component system copper resistance phosphate regulon response regulator CusR